MEEAAAPTKTHPDYRFVQSPFDPFRVSIQHKTRFFFGLLPSWDWVYQWGQNYIDFDGEGHFVAADFPSIGAARRKVPAIFESNGTLFVK